MSQNTGLAAEIERDLLKADDKDDGRFVGCFSCGSTFTAGKRLGRFCSERCRDWYDNPSYEEQCEQQRRIGPWRMIPPGAETPYMPMRRGSTGCYVQCAGCQREFESKGLRCCSADCDKQYRERRDNLVIMAEAGIEPAAKRRCEICGAIIPRWRNGRQVSKVTRFCSPKCRQRAHAAAASFSDAKCEKSAHSIVVSEPSQNSPHRDPLAFMVEGRPGQIAAWEGDGNTCALCGKDEDLVDRRVADRCLTVCRTCFEARP